MWQDFVIATVVMMFTLTTIPMILRSISLPMWTTVPMVIGSAALTVTYATLGLWLSVLIEFVALLLWAILLKRTFKP